MSWLKRFDSFAKIQEEVRVKTTYGATISVIALALMCVLFVSELSWFLVTETSNHLRVDSSRGEKLRINFDVTFPSISCSLLSIDVMDVSGSHQEDVEHTVLKKRIDAKGNLIGVPMKDSTISKKAGNATVAVAGGAVKKSTLPGYCGSCYGAEDEAHKCCRTCNDVKAAYRNKGWAFVSSKSIEQCVDEGVDEETIIHSGEGCHAYGYVEVNKVAGNFHFAPGKSYAQGNMHIHDFSLERAAEISISHDIKQLSFGEQFPGIVNPLDDTKKVFTEGGGVYQYYLKIVRTTYEYISGKQVNSNQYAVTEHHQKPLPNQRTLPGVYFFYDLSPIMVQVKESRRPFFHFLTQLCAIIGGVFTVAGIVDRMVHATVRKLNNVPTGKLS